MTAPSIFGNIVSNGPITGTIQTTGLRTDPITGNVSTVAAEFGRVYVAYHHWTSGLTIPYVTTTVVQANGISGQLISRVNLISSIDADGGIQGVIAAQGILGAIVMEPGDQSLRLGGLESDGSFSGDLVILGEVLADMVFNGCLRDGRIAAEGGIVANLTINGGLDAASAVVSRGEIGDPTYGTQFAVNGNNKSILASQGVMYFGKHAPGGEVFNGVGTSCATAAAIDALFTNGGQPLEFDLTGLDLGGLELILTDLSALYGSRHGQLTGSVA